VDSTIARAHQHAAGKEQEGRLWARASEDMVREAVEKAKEL
jgi:hypothetical protein